MTMRTLAIAAICAALGNGAAANEFNADLKKLAADPISVWVSMPSVIQAVRAQNTKTAGLSQDQIIDLDTQWRKETISGGDLISGVLGNSLSQQLVQLKQQGQGQFTEIFISDVRGLNVGQSDVTSDYWQGDEAKWQVPHDTSGIHIGEVEFDESTQSYQSQVSVPIMDGGEFIGVITVGVDLQQLASAS